MATLIGTVNEGSGAFVTANFLDKDGNAATAPNTITYRIDDVATGTEVRGDTPIGSPAQSIEISLQPADTVILNERNERERRRLTIKGDYTAGDVVVGFADYDVLNSSFEPA